MKTLQILVEFDYSFTKTVLQIVKLYTVVKRILKLTFRTVVFRRSESN